MRTFAARAQLLAALLGVVAALALGVAGTTTPRIAAAQKEQPAKKDPLRPTSPDDVSTGYANCKACHNEKLPINVADNDFARKYRSHEYVLLNEGRTWTSEDPHSTAFNGLTKPLGQSMARNLGWDVTKAPQCLTCHAIDKSPGTPLPPIGTAVDANRFETAEGITCNACHGLRKPWQRDHYDEKGGTIPWRTLTPVQKEQAGMRNLRDPVVKAQLCVSCHVGNPDEGKVVTHEMYAAGHPPLPPFELASYMSGQPEHWGYPTDPKLTFFTPKGFETFAGAEFAKAHPNWTWELYRFHPAEQEDYLARHAAVGAIAAMKAEAQMLEADAAAALKGGDGIDFARFDCYACHHDLKFPSDRQKRGYAGPPGRPTLRAAVGVPASIYAAHAAKINVGGLGAKAAGFDEKWDALQKAALARPFGDPEKVRVAAKAMTEWCDGFLKVQCECEKPLYTPDSAKQLREDIAAGALSNAAVADPEAAMCLAWAYRTLRNEAKQPLSAEAEKRLGLEIPLNVRVDPYFEMAKDRKEPKPAQFAPRMGYVNRYDAARFTEAFRGLLPGK